MSNETMSTAPKPFVFVLMPFKPEFNDIYKYGIKGAAEDVGAYSERVDEQDYTESMLDRIYNQINKADVIVADMSGQNSNVFYEVGYAHALDKIVLLLTQDTRDIPFDLKHRPHIEYGGQIETLRNKLAQKLRWAINESKSRKKPQPLPSLGITVQDIFVPQASSMEGAPTIEVTSKKRFTRQTLKVLIQNLSSETIHSVSHIYLFTSNNSSITPLRYQFIEGRRSHPVPIAPVGNLPAPENNILSVRYRLDMELPPIPSGAIEERTLIVQFSIDKDEDASDVQNEELLVLRIHAHDSIQEFPFKLKLTILPIASV